MEVWGQATDSGTNVWMSNYALALLIHDKAVTVTENYKAILYL